MIDGVEVNVGDTVFILGMGSGQVTVVSSDGSFSVKIGRNVHNFRDGGYVGNVRRVYWHNPLFIVPPKDLDLWNTFKEQSLYNYSLLVRLFGTGKTVKVSDEEAAE